MLGRTLPHLMAFFGRVRIARFVRVALIVLALLNIVAAALGSFAIANPVLFPAVALITGVGLAALLKSFFLRATAADAIRASWRVARRLYERLEAWADRSVHR